MHPTSRQPTRRASRHQDIDAPLYVSLELSHATWLVTSLSPGSEKMSIHSPAADGGTTIGSKISRKPTIGTIVPS
jgi:hypothetical protein